MRWSSNNGVRGGREETQSTLKQQKKKDQLNCPKRTSVPRRIQRVWRFCSFSVGRWGVGGIETPEYLKVRRNTMLVRWCLPYFWYLSAGLPYFCMYSTFTFGRTTALIIQLYSSVKVAANYGLG